MACRPGFQPSVGGGIVLTMREFVARLAATRRRFGTGATREKLSLLAEAARRPAVPAPYRLAWHDEVLFCLAHPDSEPVRRAAERELRRIARQLRTARPAPLRTLLNSGIAGTWITTSYSPDLLRWLIGRNRTAAIAWGDGAGTEGLEATLPLLALPAEVDGLLSLDLTTEAWVRLASRPAGELNWLLDRFDALSLSPELRERLFGTMELEVRWRLGRDSRTLTRFPRRGIHYQREPLRRDVELGQILARPLPAPMRLDRKRVAGLIDTARAVLAARGRETDPVTWANPAETVLFRLDRGIDVALFGLLPGRRLPIESYFGFVAARNRVPVAYGGGWVFFGRCEIGVNLFEEFRGGESAYLFAQVLRTYRQHFRVRQFQVDPFQFGLGNSEAIRSGAYWFYHRLGFRLTEARLRTVAEAEHQRLLARAGYRSPARVLRRFTASRLALEVASAERGESPDLKPWRSAAPELPAVSLAVTRWVGREFAGDRDQALRRAERRLKRLTGGGTGKDEMARAWFRRLAPVAAMVPDLGRWSTGDRLALGRILRAKGGPRERDYALALQRHRRFERALYELAASSASGGA